jgi:hypothetical protein
MKSVVHLGMVILAGFLTVSCQSSRPAEVVLGENDLPPAAGRDSAQLAYDLSQKTWCSNDDACSMILLLLNGEDPYRNFDERIVALDEKGIADIGWDIEADKPVTKGTLAYMLCRAVDIRGGVMMHLLNIRRYSYRQAVAEGLMVRGSEFEPLTGPEVVGIMGRAARMKDQTTSQ